MIVLPDADPAVAADAVVSSVYGATGQRCLAGSIVVGVGDAYGPVRDAVLERAAALRLGRGLDAAVDMGPVISGSHRELVIGYITAGAKTARASCSTAASGAPPPTRMATGWVRPCSRT
jgi:malonate-semialdehyde dehydrogenase (acetylating)/methylmalonate-semialdehyde dehydrogenase